MKLNGDSTINLDIIQPPREVNILNQKNSTEECAQINKLLFFIFFLFQRWLKHESFNSLNFSIKGQHANPAANKEENMKIEEKMKITFTVKCRFRSR